MIKYVLESQEEQAHYGLSYQELKDNYYKICSYTNKEFIDNLPEALHLACVVCWLKEVPSYNCLSDEGIIHQLAHFIHLNEDYKKPYDIKRVRKLFKNHLKLN